MTDSISTRSAKLNQIFAGKNVARKTSNACFTREAMLDAFLLLFEECSSEFMLKDKNVAGFVKKYQAMVDDLRTLCLSKDDFNVINTIGRGHFGQVQVVKEKQSGDVFALKTLKKSQTLAQESVAFFEEEREIMALCQNPWITALQYAFQDAHNLYLVMEYHPGGDLLSLLSKYDDILDEDTARFYLAEMVMAIHSLHVLGYVHRDIKPDNVLVDRTGHIKLADFGSSARLSADKKVHSKMPVGTPEYIAPEVLTSMDGSGGPYGVECDWWSLGVVAYEMLQGQTPFEADSVVITYSKIMNYKSSMQFSTDVQVSKNAKDLILNLCTSSQARIGYEGLTCHQFFTGTDWNNLQNLVPPYVPNLDGATDTSHFDEFEPESPDPVSHLEKYGGLSHEGKGFTGKDLPFVGFTFSRNLASNLPFSPRKAGSLPNSPLSGPPSRLERKLTMKAKELKDALQSCHTLKDESANMKKNLEEMQSTLEEKEKSLRNAEYERDLLEKERVLYDTQIKDLQRRLDLERAERNKSDSATLKLLSELKEDSQKANELRDQESRENLEDLQHIVAQLENDRFIASRRAQRLEDELKSQEKHLEVSKNRISDHQARMTRMSEEAKRSMIEWQEKLDKVTTDSEERILELQQKLTKSLQANQEATELLENMRKSKDEVHLQMQKLQKSIKEESAAESDEKSSNMVATLKSAQEDDSNLRERYREKSTEVRNLQSKIMDLEDQLFQTQRTQRKLEKDLTNKQAQEQKLQEAEKEVDTLTRYKRQLHNTNSRLEKEMEETKKLLVARDQKIDLLNGRCRMLQDMLKDTAERNSSQTEAETNPQSAVDEAELERLCEEKQAMSLKIAELESEVKIQQQKNATVEKQLEDTELKIERISKDMEMKVEDVKTQLIEVTNECCDLKKTKKSLEETILKLENEIDTREFELELKASVRQDSIARTMQENRSEVIQEMHLKITEMSERCSELVSKDKELGNKVDELTEENCDLKMANEKLEDELKEKNRAAEGMELTNSMLKATCTMLENQVEQLEIINEDYEEKQLQYNITRKELEHKIEKSDCALLEAQRSLEQEKSTRLITEEKVGKLQVALKEVQNAHIKEVDQMNTQLEKQRQRTEELTEALSEAEKRAGMAQLQIKSLERKLQLAIEENNKLQIEIERLNNHITKLKASNFELNQNIEATLEKCDELVCERAVLAEQLDMMEASHAEERLKLEATSSQQSKLIDFLQCKAEGQATKKKKLIGGGGKSWRKKLENNINVVPQQWKDLQQALEKERASTMKLQTEVNRMRQETQTAKMEAAHWKAQYQSTGAVTDKPAQSFAVLSAIQQSPSNQPSPLSAQNQQKIAKNVAPADLATPHRPKERMHHNIPHRFVNALNMRATKCAVCLDTLHFVRPSSRCAECGLVCHVKCSPNLPHTCGLPSQFVEHFSETLHEQKSDINKNSKTQSTTKLGDRREGWLRVPRGGSVKHGWVKKWIVLDDQLIQLFDKENVGENSVPSEILHLCGKDGHVTVHSAVMSSELIGTAPSDLPYILRVESRQRCWPVQNLYLLAPSFAVKQKWVTSLEFVLNEIKKKNASVEDQKLMGNVLLHLQDDQRLDINCTQLVNSELVLLGAEEGLYSLAISNPGKHSPRMLPGIERAFQISIIDDLNQVIMIAGKDRQLCSVELKQVTSRARQTNPTVPLNALIPQIIEKITNCHLFAVGQYEGNYYICAATPNSILLLRYNSGIGTFCTRKEIETSEPCNCIHFSKSHVIYGTGKFYALDIKHHTVKELLDATDPSLAFAVYGASQLNIFPIAVMDIKIPGSNEQRELLLCFNEFGLFVNSAGRNTRKKPLMWSRLPLAFAYSEPFLFVTHFNSIDVCEIPPSDAEFPSRYLHKFLEIQNPRVLGPAVSPGSIYLASTRQEQVEMVCFQGSSALATVFQPEDDEDSMSIISELSQLSSPAHRRSSVLVRSPSWSPGVARMKSVKGERVQKSSSFRIIAPLKEKKENK
ncbi:citron rho-interacting kinase-like [Acropora muricata]|uniref:citron rho-interacting kinase-like n=1 Tax=Acropora muricata TaxID=159855 RepID=UPI0034E47DD1